MTHSAVQTVRFWDTLGRSMRLSASGIGVLVLLSIPFLLWVDFALLRVNRAESRFGKEPSKIGLRHDLSSSSLSYSFPRPSGKCNRDFPPFKCCPHVNPSLLTKMPKSAARPKMLIGIGTMKGGSSFVFNLLKQHPNITPPRHGKKELHFFNHVDINPQGLDGYLREWGWNDTSAESFAGKTLLEMTPQTLMLPWAPCYLRKWLPDAKFLIVLRNPVARALSQVHFERNLCLSIKRNGGCCGPYARHLQAPLVDSLEEFLLQNHDLGCLFNDGDDSKNWPACFNNHWWGEHHSSAIHLSTLTSFLPRGFYAAQLAWWLEFFPPSQFILVNSENLYKSPLQEANRVLEFIGEGQLFGDGPGEFSVDVGDIAKYKTPTDPIFEPNLDRVIDELTKVYRRSNQEFYKLVSETGLSFEEFDDNEVSRKNGLAALNTSLAIDPKGCSMVV